MIDLDAYERIYAAGLFGMVELEQIITRLSEAEKDAARYLWLMSNCGTILDPSRNRTSLYIPNYCPISIDYLDVGRHIDESISTASCNAIKEKGDE